MGLSCVCDATEWSNCADDLDGLRRAARDASDAAVAAEDARKEADEALEKLERERSESEQCRKFRATYDLLEDGCYSKHMDYESARSNYESALSHLQSGLDTVSRKNHSVEWSCNVRLASTGSSMDKSVTDSRGALYKRLMGILPIQLIIETCKKNMSESECKECLGIP